jgi:hypothetical protein
MDFTIIPDILKNASMEEPRPRSLRQMGELLKIMYELTGHPILKQWRDYEPLDPFSIDMNNLERTKLFNRTIIERTITQSQYLSQLETGPGISMSNRFWKWQINYTVVPRKNWMIWVLLYNTSG